VDTLGLVLVALVHCAGVPDCHGAKLVFLRLAVAFPGLKLIWADGAYAGTLIGWLAALTRHLGTWVLEIVKRPSEQTGFTLLPRRWVVERTFAWLCKYRRLSKDYEETSHSSETWIYVAMIHIMVRRLAPVA
jgi:putative transposase